MVPGINLLVDFAFRMLFGNELHPRLTICLLNALLGGKPRIVRVRILNIEVQTWLPLGMAQRLTFYTSRSYVDQLKKGQDCSELRASICICILAEPLFSEHPVLHPDFRLRDQSSSVTLTDDLQIHFLQLSHLQVTTETLYDASEKERWLFFVREAHKLTTTEIMRLFPGEEFAEAAGVLEMISKTPQQKMEYEARLKFQRDQRARRQGALIEGHRLGLEEGLQRGYQQGRQEGLRDGRQQGRHEGLQEGRHEGRIVLLQEILGQPVSTPDSLACLSADQLKQLEEDLQRQFRDRGI